MSTVCAGTSQLREQTCGWVRHRARGARRGEKELRLQAVLIFHDNNITLPTANGTIDSIIDKSKRKFSKDEMQQDAFVIILSGNCSSKVL